MSATQPRLLDLFCCAGGAGMGYHRAGFDVTGVDVRPQPRYPFAFVQADALDYVAAHGHEYDVVHASPPCQAYTVSRTRARVRPTHPRLIDETRAALRATGSPFAIENVPGAPMRDATVLCGASLGLGARCADGNYRQLRRHRLFECSMFMLAPACACDDREKIGVYGSGGGWSNRFDPARRGYKGNKTESAAALGIDWMVISELSASIPPAYTEFVGRHLLAAVYGETQAAAA